MTKLYTRTGDHGETALYGGTRISKDDLRVSCYGTIDELNSMIGVAYSLIKNKEIKKILNTIQNNLFLLAAEIASDKNGLEKLREVVDNSEILYLEEIIDKFQKRVGDINGFTIPGKNTSSSILHVARTITRRAERLTVKLSKQITIRSTVIKYLNRLSDLLYILAIIEAKSQVIDKIKDKVIKRINSRFDKNLLNLEIAKKMARGAENKAREIGVAIVFSVVDSGGNLLLLHRMNNTMLASIDISINKAYTAVALRIPTNEVMSLVQPGKELYGIQNTDNRIITFGGGFPLKLNGEIIGGIGISGGTVEQDVEIGLESIKVFELEKGG
ncbi:cob(I)yrinic acid a,c-diamide adenosyltransferase [Thermohalobacter berrensis]|uniref:Corrinoid adenosyltransferase n=1 Tax=Thermohalobacter berrensis TaxID=99594 RepID=A0A419T5L5_9FIRM|nr:cob(I)yrinic acid a,c-diamide adenosyltransferase [Thermohalobacter berrensis]RKD32761.1 ATP:cob(I)alamin adenosyltransferase [Thermohalobacter berrensis]